MPRHPLAWWGDPDALRPGGRAYAAFVTGTALVTVLHWWLFFHLGSPRFAFTDWVKESASLEILRTSIRSGTIPWEQAHVIYHKTTLMAANPELTLTPDVWLLPWLSNQGFFTLHVTGWALIGLAGCLVLAARGRIAPAPFVAVWLMAGFNGYVVTHLAMAHLMWTGYFCFPWLAVFVLDIQRSRSWRPALLLGLALGVMVWNGSIHLVVAAALTLALLGVLLRRAFVRIAAAGAVGVLAGLGRLLPGAVYFPSPGEYLTGIPWGVLPKAFVTTWTYYSIGIRSLGQWEYSLFLGWCLLLLLLVGGAVGVVVKARASWPWLVAGAVLFLLSMDRYYEPLYAFGLPFSTERVSTRFVAVPLLIGIAYAGLGLTSLVRRHRFITFCVLALSAVGAVELARHSVHWSVGVMQRDLNDPMPDLTMVTNTDTRLHLTVWLSVAVSALTVAATLVALRRLAVVERRSRNDDADGRAPRRALPADAAAGAPRESRPQHARRGVEADLPPRQD